MLTHFFNSEDEDEDEAGGGTKPRRRGIFRTQTVVRRKKTVARSVQEVKLKKHLRLQLSNL